MNGDDDTVLPVMAIHSERGYSADSICSEVSSVAASKSNKSAKSARSTFQDTLINSVNILLGVGVLSLPYAFAKGGWLVAPLCAVIAIGAGYTAYILGMIQRDIIQVTHPLGASNAASGYYKRCLTSYENGVRRYTLELGSSAPILDPTVVGNATTVFNVNESAPATPQAASTPGGAAMSSPTTCEELPEEEVRPEHHVGVWVITWMGKSDPRWRLQYEGPQMVEGGFAPRTQHGSSQGNPSSGDALSAGAGSAAVTPEKTFTETAALLKKTSQAVLVGGTEHLIRVTFETAPLVERLEQYPDIGLASFGKAGHVLLNLLFIGELYLFLVSMVILAVKNIEVLFPHLTKVELSWIYFALILPQALVRDFSKLAFLSYFGLFACAVIFISLLYFGFSTSQDLPSGSGSIINFSSDTRLFDFRTFSYSFSLVMGSFGGHSLFPSFRADMRRPVGYTKVVNWTFMICTLYYMLVGVLGYLMYGGAVKDIVTLSFDQDKWESKAVAVCIAVVSYSKHGLTSNVLCHSLEQSVVSLSNGRVKDGWYLYGTLRTGMTVMAVVGALLIPSFGMVMAFLGAAVSCVISLIFPLASYIRLMSCRMSLAAQVLNWILFFICCYFCVTGTINAFGVDL